MKARSTESVPGADNWIKHSKRRPFWTAGSPIEVRLIDGTTEILLRPEANLREYGSLVAEWRPLPQWAVVSLDLDKDIPPT